MTDLKSFAASRRTRALVLLAVLSGTASSAQHRSADTAVYWMTADTVSGMTAMAAGGSSPMMRALADGGSQAAFSRSLQLQLGTGRRAAAEPNAEHLPPTGLHAGPPGLLGQDMAAMMADRRERDSGSTPAGLTRKKSRKDLLRRGLGSLFGQ